MKALARYQIILLGEQRHIGVGVGMKAVVQLAGAEVGLSRCRLQIQNPFVWAMGGR